MGMISIGQAARFLGLDPETMRRRESPDGRWMEIFGHRIRVFRLDMNPGAFRRYDEREIRRLLQRLRDDSK